MISKEFYFDDKVKINKGEIMEEEWKDIEGFLGCYQISNLGRVKSLKRVMKYSGTNQTGVEFEISKKYPEKILKTSISRGYEHVSLKTNSRSKTFSIHKLVATHFIPNPNNYPIINHIDENKLNNVVTNLEWCDQKYNSNYGTRNERIANKLRDNPNYYIPVLCYDLSNNLVARYESAEAAGRTIGVCGSAITSCCRLYYGKVMAGGYKWKYEKSDLDISTIEYVPQNKEVTQFDLDGNYIESYISISSAARAMNKNVQNFSMAIKKIIAYDFIWLVGNDYLKVNEILEEINERQHHILQIDDNDIIVNKYKSLLDAEKQLGLDHSNISFAVLSKTKEGKLYRKCSGYYWVDIDKDPQYEIDFKFKKGHGEKRVIQCDLDGNEIRMFESIRDAQEFLGLDRDKSSSIYDCFKPNSKKKIAHGYTWKRP